MILLKHTKLYKVIYSRDTFFYVYIKYIIHKIYVVEVSPFIEVKGSSLYLS